MATLEFVERQPKEVCFELLKPKDERETRIIVRALELKNSFAVLFSAARIIITLCRRSGGRSDGRLFDW